MRFEELFGKPPSLPVVIEYSNEGLLPWEGGAVFEKKGEPPILRLRASLKTKEKLWGIYSKDEILSHELVHMARKGFNEPLFEEILAYRTSSCPFRQFFGPLFASSKESTAALLSLLLSTSLAFFFPLLSLLLTTPILLFFLLRLLWKQWIFRKALTHFSTQFPTSQEVMAYILTCKDEEILQAARKQQKPGTGSGTFT